MKSQIQILLILVTIILALVLCEKSIENTINDVLENKNTLSERCKQDLKILMQRINSTEENTWASRMIEATSRIATSKSSYDYGDSGHFEECIQLQSKEDHIKGKYCIADITYQYMNFTSQENPVPLTDLTLRITGGMHMLRFPTRAVCLPSNCSDTDAGFIMKKLQYSNTTIKSLMCQTKEEVYEPLDSNAYVGIVIIVLIAIVVILATMYDLYCQKYTQERGKPGLVAFSVYTNGKKLLQTSNNRTSSLDCLDGIRVLSMTWVMAFHMYVKYIAVPVFNSKESIQISGGILGILFTTGHLACDALFIVGGTLVTYVYFSRTKEGDLTLYTIIKHYIHRYIRLTPALIGVIIVVATLIKYTGSGPKWPVMDTIYQEGCQKYWWSTILYIHNEVYVDNMCVAHTWYIAVDTQLYIISPLIFYMLKKHTKIGVTCIIFAILASISVAFVKGYDSNIMPKISDAYYANVDVAFVMLYFYLSTITRAAPWFMGTLLGYLLTRPGFKKPLSQVIIIPVWIISLLVLLLCALGNYPLFRMEEYSRFENAVFSSLVRPSFALAVGWVIWACATNQGGIINSILSWSVFKFINKFIYSMYLLHPNMIDIIVYSQKAVIYFSIFNMIFWFWGIFVLVFALSIGWVLVFEIPPVILERLAFAKIESKKKSSEEKLHADATNEKIGITI